MSVEQVAEELCTSHFYTVKSWILSYTLKSVKSDKVIKDKDFVSFVIYNN